MFFTEDYFYKIYRHEIKKKKSTLKINKEEIVRQNDSYQL